MNARHLVAEALALGIELRGEGNHLRYRPKDALPATLLERLRDHKVEVLAILAQAEPEVAWRAEAMRPQVPRCGPIPMLLARADAPMLRDAPGHCLSCGDPLGTGQRWRCTPCQRAAWLVLNEERELVE